MAGSKVYSHPEVDTETPIISHVVELRKRLMWSALVLAATTVFSLIFARDIFKLLESRAGNITLIYTEMTEMVGAYFRVSFVSGLVLALPFIVYQVVMFVRPGLTLSERKYLYFLLPGILISFVAGAAFGYFVMIPPMIKFLITFGSDIATPQIRARNFVSIMLRLLFAVGICFELPVVIFFLSRIGVVNAGLLSKYRRHAIVGAFILATIITPTFDPLNQTIVALPLIVLYEVGILLARIGRKRQRA